MEEVVSMPNSGGGAFQAVSTAKTRLPLQGCEDYLKAPLLPRPGPCACLCASTCASNLVGPGQVLRFSLPPSALLIWYLEFCLPHTFLPAGLHTGQSGSCLRVLLARHTAAHGVLPQRDEYV